MTTTATITPETLHLGTNRWVPNNPRMPVLIYRGAIPADAADPAAALEALFAANGWQPKWRAGIFGYHHYHAAAHEALGVAQGSARLVLGGPDGVELTAAVGDVLVLPVGTGHCCLLASEDFLVVGAYPPDTQVDLRREAPDPKLTERIAAVPPPSTDPVGGAGGALPDLWAGDQSLTPE